MHPNMRVSELINKELKEWDVGLLEDYVHPDDISLIRSMAISSTHRRDTFCWNYTKNGQYTVKSGYWIAQNLLKPEEEKKYWNQVAVMRNLVRQNMRCDNYCPRWGKLEESVPHAIFECPPALQVWSLSATTTSPGIFPVASVYTNMDYLFWRKNEILEPDQDIDPYPWIIWYICKTRNDKLFKGIDRDPLELVRYAESECQAWFNANEMIPPVVLANNNEESQVLSLGNICLLDGSWTASDRFSGCGWVWMDSGENTQLMGTRNFTRCESALHSEVETLRWAMENMLQHSPNQSFGTDCKELIAMIKEPQEWPSFET
uniref:RNase H type-1 domain-containing protein n=1 Tax=Brassica oleracea var. oleracea TaxID=109376 RepID=A0A0D3CDF9_BRAOL